MSNPNSLAINMLAGLAENSFNDVTLVGNDDSEVRANRVILAIRSPVLKAMLCGDFREASSPSVRVDSFSGKVISAAVEFCYSDDIVSDAIHEQTEDAALALAHLSHFSEFYEIPLLEEKALKLGTKLMESKPELSCVVFKECTILQLSSNKFRSAAWNALISYENANVFFSFISSEENRALLKTRDFEDLIDSIGNLKIPMTLPQKKWNHAVKMSREKGTDV